MVQNEKRRQESIMGKINEDQLSLFADLELGKTDIKIFKNKKNYDTRITFNFKYDESKIPEAERLNVFERNGSIILGHQDMIHFCNCCEQWKNQAEFAVRSSIDRYGRRTIKNTCKECTYNQIKLVRVLIKKHGPAPKHCENCGCHSEKIFLDHCHKTGKFRGWLCRMCNMQIGALGDNVESLERAINYLKLRA